MRIFASKSMERYLFEKIDRPLISDQLRSNFLTPALFQLQDCVFFDYLLKPESRERFSFHRYGDRSRCEASVNGFHLQDFCNKNDAVISSGFVFLEKFIEAWRMNFNRGVVIYFGIVPAEEEFGPDVTFTFHKKRENERTWMDLESIEKLDAAFMAVEV